MILHSQNLSSIQDISNWEPSAEVLHLHTDIAGGGGKEVDSSLNARLKITKTRRSSTQADLIADMLSKADFDAAVELMNQDRDKSNQIWFDTVGDRIEDWRGLVFQESSRSTARFV